MTDSQAVRLGLVHWTASPSVGGVESYLPELALGLSRQDIEVTVIVAASAGAAREYRTISSELLDPRVIAAEAGRPAYSGALRQFLTRAVAESGINVVHGHNLQLFTPVPARVLAELRRERVIAALHHTVHSPPGDTALPAADYHYAVSQHLSRQWLERTGLETEVTYLGIDTSRFPPVERTGATPVILHPARLVEEKGAAVSVHMLRELRALGHSADLLLTDTPRTADDPRRVQAQRASLRRLIAELALDEHVQFVRSGYLDMPGLYGRADVVIYPSLQPEPLGLVPLEAMCSALPVVVSRDGAMVETVIDGETGFTVPRGDVRAFAGRTSMLLADRVLGRRMGEAGRRLVLDRFNIERHVDAMAQRYRRLPVTTAGP